MLPFLSRFGQLVLIGCTVFMLLEVIDFRRERNRRETEGWAPQSKPEIELYRPHIIERFLPWA